MRCKRFISAILFISLFSIDINTQDVERMRPAEWDGLAHGGRFMDLFLPMPVQGELTSDTWGADNVKPRYIENGLEDNEWSYWGGNAKLGEDGKYHLFVCRWREDLERGHHEWHNSIVVHAVADQPTGPYNVKDTLGPGHNPELFQLSDGRYVVYFYKGYYISNSLNGPWESKTFAFNTRDRKIIEGLSNLTFAQREDGSYLMVCRGGGVWLSQTGISPYNQVTDKRVYPPVEGRFEDPGEAYMPGIAKHEDGTVVDWYKYERIKVLQDDYGRATQAHFAVIDVLKNDDKQSDDHSSKHICIPLTVGRLLAILDSEAIGANTKTIRVKIAAEEGFDPRTDMDIESLRFGASEEVNFGKGCKAVNTEKSGDDLIVTFDGAGNGIGDDHFTAKLLGKNRDGKLLFGYARLPGVDYLEPALSARAPVFIQTESGADIKVETQNFGQVASKATPILILDEKKETIASGTVPALKPFEKVTAALSSKTKFKADETYGFTVVIDPDVKNPTTFQGKVTAAVETGSH